MKRLLLAVALMSMACLLETARAEEPVYFEDETLKAAVEETLWVVDPTPTDMLELLNLTAWDKEIESLVGLEYANNLRVLSLRYTHVRDLSPLAGLVNLETIVLHRTYLTDLSPLSGLSRLSYLDLNTTNISDISALSSLSSMTSLDLRNNQVSDIAALSGMVNLEELILERNDVSDLSSLLGLTHLSYLNLAYNPLSDEAYDVQIPQIIANNPGIEIHHDERLHTLVLSSSEGGRVIDPGEGTFNYPYVEWLRIEARADAGYVFIGWYGSLFTTANPAFITIEQDHEICAVFSPVADANDPVVFADARLEAAVEEALGITDPTAADMLNLTVLSAGNLGIENLDGIEYATNLQSLTLESNTIQDLSPLSQLTALSYLDLNGAGVSDISALTSLASLTQLDLRSNPLSDEAIDVDIPQILANNPGINLQYDCETYVPTYSVTLSSGEGGSVAQPGEGTFTYAATNGLTLRLEAKAEPGYAFTAWTGTCYSTRNPIVISVDKDYEITATFSLLPSELHVDDDAPDDPTPNSPDGSDPLEDGTVDHPFDSIQEAIDAATDGATIRVCSGSYRENLVISQKSITLVGREPDDPNGADLPVIHADQEGPIVWISGTSESSCTLSGFAITAGWGQGSIVDCSGGAAAFTYCLIAGNRPAGSSSVLIQCTDSNAAFVNCTIVDNYLGACSSGLRAVNSRVSLTNSIFYHNTGDCSTEGSELFCGDDATEITITYSDVEGGWSGVGNIDVDPLFVSRGQWTDPQGPLVLSDPSDSSAAWLMGDYHLLSQTGRWDSVALSWVCDEATSPCIDAGDPAGDVGYEPSPNGGILNLGVFGGTTEASKSD